MAQRCKVRIKWMKEQYISLKRARPTQPARNQQVFEKFGTCLSGEVKMS